jgi:hypothetical protein
MPAPHAPFLNRTKSSAILCCYCLAMASHLLRRDRLHLHRVAGVSD